MSHEASSEPSPQSSFPSHCWFFGRHFPLPHLKVPSGHSGEEHVLNLAGATHPPSTTPPATPLTACQLVTAVPAVVHTVADPEQGFAQLVLACELMAGVASWGERGEGRTQPQVRLGPGPSVAASLRKLGAATRDFSHLGTAMSTLPR